MSKSTINRRRKEGESTKAAAKRLAQGEVGDFVTGAAQEWLSNKKRKPLKKKAPPKKVETAAPSNNVPKNKKRR